MNNLKTKILVEKHIHTWKETFCGDGCKEHPGVWKVCLTCYKKIRKP